MGLSGMVVATSVLVILLCADSYRFSSRVSAGVRFSKNTDVLQPCSLSGANRHGNGVSLDVRGSRLWMSDIMMGDDGNGFESEEIAVVAGAGDADITEDDEEEEEEDDEDHEGEEDDLDGLRLSQMSGLVDDDDDDLEVFDEDDEFDDDLVDGEQEGGEDDEGGKAKRMAARRTKITLKSRRAMRNKAIKMRKEHISWEERFLDDPLKAESPTTEIEKPVDPFKTTFVAIGSCAKEEELRKRTEVWTHHMQWARRNSLLPDTARVDKSFTRLTSDRMAPQGQMVLMKSNSAEEVKKLMESEPIQSHGGVRWDVYEMGTIDEELYENLSAELNPVREPFIVTGTINYKNNKGELDSQLNRDHLKYHDSSDRVIFIGDLHNTDRVGEDGYVLAFSASTKKDALNYLSQDPLVLAGVLSFDSNTDVTPVNEQDVDGLHHLMARSFAEKNELDAFHYMDPEDLFDLPLDPSLVPQLNTELQNQLFLDELKSRGMSFRYERYSYNERYKGFIQDEDADTFNEYMGLAQKIRLEPAVEGIDTLKKFQQSNEDAD